MKKSHAVVRTSEKPTFAQLKETMGQIDSGRITKDGLQSFLRNPDQVIQDHSPMLYRSFVCQWFAWQEKFPSREAELATRMIRFLPGAPALSLMPANPAHWEQYQKALIWQHWDGVHFVGTQDVACDSPNVNFSWSIKKEFDKGIEDLFKGDDESEKDFTERIHQDLIPLSLALLWAPVNIEEKIERDENVLFTQWDLGWSCNVHFDWLKKLDSCSITEMLDSAFASTLLIVGGILHNHMYSPSRWDIKVALGLLDMWGSGNYPLGFDRDNRLVVLCAK